MHSCIHLSEKPIKFWQELLNALDPSWVVFQHNSLSNWIKILVKFLKRSKLEYKQSNLTWKTKLSNEGGLISPSLNEMIDMRETDAKFYWKENLLDKSLFKQNNIMKWGHQISMNKKKCVIQCLSKLNDKSLVISLIAEGRCV